MALSPEQLSTIALVASDYAYLEGATPGSFLSSLQDNKPTEDWGVPGSLWAGLAPQNPLLSSTLEQDGVNGLTTIAYQKWVVVRRFEERNNDGFGAVLLRTTAKDDDGKYWFAVAFQGTDGWNGKDWYANLDLARGAWEERRADVFSALATPVTVDGAGVIPFREKLLIAGQSLGGALAQYAAYDFAYARQFDNTVGIGLAANPFRENPHNYVASDVSMITFNAFGGIQGLRKSYNGENSRVLFDRNVAAGIQTRHYAIDNDVVHRLGDGHLNGSSSTTFKFAFRKFDGAQEAPGPKNFLGIVESHRIEQGFYYGFDKYGGDFQGIPNLPGRTQDVMRRVGTFGYIPTGGSQNIGAFLSRAFSANTGASAPAAWGRVAAGVLGITLFGSRSEVDTLVKLLARNGALSGGVSETVNSIVQAISPSRLGAFLLGFLRGGPLGGLISLIPGELIEIFNVNKSKVELDDSIHFLEAILPQTTEGIQNLDLNIPDLPVPVDESEDAAASRLVFLLGLQGGDALGAIQDSITRDRIASSLVLLSGQAWDDASARELGIRLRGGTGWFEQTVRYVAARSVPTGKALEEQEINVARAFADSIRYAAGSHAFRSAAQQEINAWLGKVSSEVAALSADFTVGDVTVASSSYGSVDSLGYKDYRAIADAYLAEFADRKKSAVYSLVAEGNEHARVQALDAVMRAGQATELASGAGKNPFDSSGFDPLAVTVVGVVGESHGRLLTLSLPFEAASGGQNAKLTLAGTNAGNLRLFDGEEVIGQNGVFMVTIPEGARQIALTLLEDGDIDADSTVTLKAQLVDAAGVATHVERLEANLTLTARIEQAPEATVTGGDGIDVFIQADNGYAGKRAAVSGGAGRDLIGGSGLEDQIDGGDGDDVLFGAGGLDTISGGLGNDFISLSVSGAASIDAGAGDDIVDARRIVDFQLREADLSLPAFEHGTYAAVWKDVLANLRFTAQGDVRGDRVGNAPSGAPYAISFSPTSFSGVSQGIGLKQDNQVGVVAGGGASFSLAARSDGAGWDVTYAAGGQRKVYALVAGRFAGPEVDSGVSIAGGAGRDQITGSLGPDLVRGGTEDDQIAGHDGDDVLMGEAGADRIFGGAGEDFVDGGLGNDFLVGEAGDDALAGADGDDWLEGDASDTPLASHGNDHLRGGAGADTLLGQGGNDELIGDEGNDQLIGGDGDDELVGGAGDDSLFGGAGADMLSGGSENDTLSGEAGADTLRGGSGNDQLFGGVEDDLLEGDAGIDQLQGGSGNDLLFGGSDDDTLFGEAGDDEIAGEAGNDSINGGTGADLLYGGGGADTYHYARGDGADRIFDTPGEGNTIRLAQGLDLTPVSFEVGSLVIRVAAVGGGPSGDDIRLEGFDPNDPLNSSPIDFFEVWNGSGFNKVTLASVLEQKGLKITGTEGADQLRGTILRDLLFGTGGDDTIDALEGNDSVDGGAGADVLIGGPGVDTLDGGSGADILIGGTGNDTYLVDDAADEVIEFAGEGIDTVHAFADFSLVNGAEVENLRLEGSVTAGIGNDLPNTITGNAFANVLSGGGGNDGLFGGQGDDRLIGGAGNDGLRGGLGNDTYVFAADGGSDGIGDVDVVYDGFFGSGTDTVEIEGEPSQVVITRTLSDARIVFPATGAAVNIALNYFRHQQGQFVYRMEQIRFADGVVRPFDDFVTPAPTTPFADTLFGGSGADTLAGLNGADTLYGMGGDDLLEGGAGSDVLSGGDGNDTYLWGRGAGRDTIDDFDGAQFHIDSAYDNPRFFYTGYRYGFSHSANEVETIRIGAELAPADIHVSRNGASYVLTIRGSCETLTLASWGSDVALRPEFHKATRDFRIVFADGTVWTRPQMDDLITPTPPTEEADTIQGTPRNDVLLGLGGNDSMFGFAGHDTLDGGAGNDSLDGGSGSDTYLFGRGSGADTITAGDNSAESIDRILFAPDVAPAEVVVRGSGDLTLSIRGTGDAITLRSYLYMSADSRLDLVQFADGTVWDKQALLVQSVTGTDGADTLSSYGPGAVLDGRGGDDKLSGSGGNTFIGGAGNDLIEIHDGTVSSTIVFGAGSGLDTVTGSNQDIVVLGAGITAADLRVVETNTDLRLELPASGDAITIVNWRNILSFFGVPSPSYFNAVKEVRFADGTVWNQAALQSRAVSGAPGTAGSDQIWGTNNPDVLEGFAGNDELAGFSGIDVYRFDRGYGADTVFDSFFFGPNTSNTVRLGEGLSPFVTYVTTSGSNTILEFGAGDRLTVRNGIGASFAPVDRVEFADGTVWSGATVGSMARTAVSGGNAGANTLNGGAASEYIDAKEGNDTINASAGNDVLVGGAGNDSLFGGAGSDVYLFEPGFGIDTIADPGNAGEIDRVRFSADIAPAHIGVTRDAAGTLYLVRSPSDRILFAPTDIERVEFADGTVWDAAQLEAMAGVLPGSPGDDLLFGTPGDDTISGLGGNDFIRGYAGNDLIDPGAGNDTSVEGGEGSDTFVLAPGNGDDAIVQLDASDLYTDTLSVQALPRETRATRDENHLWVAITGADARVRLDNWFAPGSTDANRIDQVRFADGTIWDRAQLVANLTFTEPSAGNDRIFGLDAGESIAALPGDDSVLGRGGDDILDGGAGSDLLEGGEGANTYLFDAGGGADRVVALNDGALDTLRLGPGITPAGVRLVVPFATSDLMLQMAGSADRVTIQGGYADALGGKQTIQIAFADGTLWSADSLAARADVMEPPVLVAPLPDRSVTQDQPIEFQVASGTFSDPDAGDMLTLSAGQASGAGLPGWLGFDPASGLFRGTPGMNDVASYNLRVTATDSSGLGTSDTFFLTVVNVNDAPQVVVPFPDHTLTAGQSASLSFPAYWWHDPDANPISFSAQSADGSPTPSWLTFNPATRTFNANTTAQDVGVYQLRIVATDNLGASGFDSFQFTLLAPPAVVTPDGNHSPVLMQQIPDQTTSVARPFLLTIAEGTFFDRDVADQHGRFCGDVLAYQATLASGAALPAWLAFDAATQTFSGTPVAADAGELAVRVLAYDTNGASAADTFLLKVEAISVNRPPMAASVTDQSALEDAAFDFAVPAGTFTDPDAGDTLTLSAALADGSALPAWLQFSAASGRFSGTPANADVGDLTVRLTAADSAAASASTDFRLDVVNVNDAPLLAVPIVDRSVPVNTSFSFTIPAGTFTDVDAGDSLTLSAAAPSWLSFDPATGTFSGFASEDVEGAHAIVLTATDESGATASDEFVFDIICTEGVVRIGTGGADTLTGTSCDDVLDGAAGVDTLIGKRGNDVYLVDATWVRDPKGNEGLGNGEDPPPPGHGENQNDGDGSGGDGGTGGPNWRAVTDTVIEMADGGYDTVVATASYVLPDNVEALRLAGSDAVDGTGNALDNAIAGNSAANALAGGAGDDLLAGRGGNDRYIVNANEGADLIDERDGGGQDFLEFGAGVSSGEVGLGRGGDDLVFVLAGDGNSVTIADWFASGDARVEHVRFADGTVWSAREIERMFAPAGPSTAGAADPVARQPVIPEATGTNLQPFLAEAAPPEDPKKNPPGYQKHAEAQLRTGLPDHRFDFEQFLRTSAPEAPAEGRSAEAIARAWARGKAFAESLADGSGDAEPSEYFLQGRRYGLALGAPGLANADLGLEERGAAYLRTLEGLREGFRPL